MTAELLLVDDDRALSRSLEMSLTEADYRVECVETASEAVEMASSRRFDVALVDLGLPDGSGLDVLSTLSAKWPPVPSVCLTAKTETEAVVAAMRAGATDFLTKPVKRRRLVGALREALDLHGGSVSAAEEVEFVGSSEEWLRVVDHVELVAATPSTTVLLTGERGVGKEVAARMVHRCSARSDGPFVAVNCACLNHSLAESQLFGHEAGAFTGAEQRHEGYFEMADGGTLLLDEVGELPDSIQSKLLRALEQRTFRRIGSTQESDFDVRLVFATNRRLQKMRDEGEFRADLLDRISVFEIAIPPLRERRSDIGEFARYFAAQMSEAFDQRELELSDQALEVLGRYDWPGNVRGLKNCIERAAILARGGPICVEHLPADVRTRQAAGESASRIGEDVSLEELERAHVREVFERHDRNVTHAAEVLGVARATLRRKLEKYELADYGD